MNSRNFDYNSSINEQTNPDILLHIMIKLDVNQIILLWFAAKYSDKYWENKGKMKETNIFKVLSNVTFWQRNASFHLQPKQLYGVTNFSALMLDRHNAYKIIQEELDNSIYYKKSLLHFMTGEYEGLSGITVKEIATLLIADDADKLFCKIIATPKLLPLIKKDDYDVNDIHACVGTKLLEKHLHFIGLFTCMIKLKAVNCFDLFARTYLLLASSVPCYKGDVSDKYYNLFDTILSIDVNFRKYYMGLSIKLSSNYMSPIASIIYCLEVKDFDFLRSSFNSISNKRLTYLLDQCEQWKPPIPKATLMMFCTESEYKKSLSEAAMKTLSIKSDHTNLNENINELINLRSTIIDTYDQWILELRDRILKNQNSFDIRPK